MLSEKQKNKFLDITGYEYLENAELKGIFRTEFPFNNKDYKYSPYTAYYIFDKVNKLLYIGMTHRMTNMQVYVFDENGGKVEVEDNEYVFTHGYNRMLKIIKEQDNNAKD